VIIYRQRESIENKPRKWLRLLRNEPAFELMERNQYRSEKGEKKHIRQETVGKIALEKEG